MWCCVLLVASEFSPHSMVEHYLACDVYRILSRDECRKQFEIARFISCNVVLEALKKYIVFSRE